MVRGSNEKQNLAMDEREKKKAKRKVQRYRLCVLKNGNFMEIKEEKNNFLKKYARIVYALQILNVFTGGAFSFIGMVISHLKSMENRLDETGLISILDGVTIITILVQGIWISYRSIKGWVHLISNKPMYIESTMSSSSSDIS